MGFIQYAELAVIVIVMVLVGVVKYEHGRIVTLEADNSALHGAVEANQNFITASEAAAHTNDAHTNANLTALETAHETDGIVAPVLAGTVERLRPLPAKNRHILITGVGLHL